MSVRLKLIFPEQYVREPIIATMVREFNVEPNIRRASVEEHFGWIILELGGGADDIERCISWLGERSIDVELLNDVIES
ncbi:MAG TPA: NIL domain-containing protein [Acidimicrobiales bacterium]|nr:NIL domain-containing protein [Acidimicrobiales bacterium]